MAQQPDVLLNSESVEHRSLADLFRSVVDDLARVMQAEIRLARVELWDKAKQASVGAGVLGTAAVAALLCGACVVTTCIAALALVMPLWLAALIMAILLGISAGGAYAAGRAILSRIDPMPQRTMETLKENIEWTREQTQS